MHALLIDLDGVIYQDDEVVPGAAEAVAWMRRQGIAHAFVTNTSSASRDSLLDKLARFGVPIAAERVFTPALVAAQWLLQRPRHQPAALFMPASARADLAAVRALDDDAESGAGSVVIGDLGSAWSFAHLNRAFRLLVANADAPLLSLGATRYWRAADGLRLDVGPFVAALECAIGRRAVVVGKPAREFYELAVRALHCAPAQAIMIGDDIAVDVAGAQQAGLRGILVRTGKFRPADLAGDTRPDGVLGSIAELPGWWQRHAGQDAR
jgi:HAD superfamily hydrolase (TIGR01458 family)